MSKYRTTRNGDEIEISKLTDSHLINIYNMITRAAEKGLTVMYGGGFDVEDMRGDVDYLYGEEVWNYDESYLEIRKEYNKRFSNGGGKIIFENDSISLQEGEIIYPCPKCRETINYQNYWKFCPGCGREIRRQNKPLDF